MCSDSRLSEKSAFQQEFDDCTGSHSSLRSQPDSLVLLPSPDAVLSSDHRKQESLDSSAALWLGPANPRLEYPASWHQQPWWETEVLKFVRSQRVELVLRLLRFRLYGRLQTLQNALRACSPIRLDDILESLVTEERQRVAINKEQKVDQILDLVEPIFPSCKFGSVWKPSETASKDASCIASCIHDESCALFREVRFEDWVRHALGYPEESVNLLFCKHGHISVRIRRYIQENPIEREKFGQVQENLRKRSLLAHQAVLHGLLPPAWPMHFHLNSLCEPLNVLVQDQSLSLSALLTRLPLLAVRFDNVYKNGPLRTRAQFSTEANTFDTLLSDSSPLECAKEMTRLDTVAFEFLSARAFKNNGRELLSLLQMKDAFQDEVAECCKAYPNLNHRLNEIAQELYRCHNWHRLTALVAGQRQAQCDSPYFSLINPNDNFAACRDEMKMQPGIPFLKPYCAEYSGTGETDIGAVFSFLSCSTGHVLAQSARRSDIFGFINACIRGRK